MNFSGAWHGEIGACMGLILHAGIKNFSDIFPEVSKSVMLDGRKYK